MASAKAPCSCLQKCNEVVEKTLEKLFRRVGKFVGEHPWPVIGGSIFVSLAFGAGFFANWTEESRTDKLWIPQDAQAVDDQAWVTDVFGFDVRFGEILLKPDGNGNALEAQYIRQFYTAYALMENTTSKAESGYRDKFNATYSWNGYKDTKSICFKPDGISCSTTHILDVLGYDYSKIWQMSDDDILKAINNASNWNDISGGLNGSDSIFGMLLQMCYVKKKPQYIIFINAYAVVLILYA